MTPWRSRFAVAVLSGAAVAGGFVGGNALLNKVEFARAEATVDANRDALSHVDDLATVFRHVGKVLEPSVVNIQVRKEIKVPGGGGDDLLRKFFRDHGGGGGMMPDMPDNNGGNNNGNGGNGNDEPDQQDEIEVGTGSGVIMEVGDGYGYILTNNHVAGDAQDMDITLSDGRHVKNGKLLGADAKSDLAVVRIKADNLIPAHWGNSDDLEKGDWVMAFGSPFGYIGSMTHGIVSALNRSQVGIIPNGYENFIQVDAPINPGNSGGPLVNLHGEVIGINTAIASRSGGFQGIGFAIPSNQAKVVYQTLKEHGKVVRGWLGVEIGNVADALQVAQSFGFDKPTGVIVDDTFPNTPATGKLEKRDIITQFNGQQVDTADELRNAVAATAPNSEVKITVFRHHEYQTVTLTVGTQPADLEAAIGHGGNNGSGGDDAGAVHNTEALGMKLSTPTDDLLKQLNLPSGTNGAVITSVAPRSAASEAGLRPGDLITDVGETSVTNANDAAAALNKVDPVKGVTLTILTSQGSRFVFLQSNTNTGNQ